MSPPITPQERQAAARSCGLHEQYLYQILVGIKRAPAERCPALERALWPRLTCDALRPDVRWARIPDPAWPHPEGRPAIDVAAPAEPTADEVRDAA